ncbi:MAG: aminotransferase class I and II [Muribaculaceae bacterium]|nr:aminotransferase class I and II [Muribaculaceae bacterium]
MELRHQSVDRYIEPLREGGSLPALAEADDGFKYVVKFRGAGHGAKALIAELIGGEIARAVGLNVPEIVFLDVPEQFGITEADEEIQDLLKASRGLNLGLHFLSGAVTMDAYVNPVDADMASRIVWIDAFLTNVDRTARNTNMLQWHGSEVWLIDHGASLFFHHSWSDPEKAALSPFSFIKDHALLHKASRIEAVDKAMHEVITPDLIHDIVNAIPDEWLVRDDVSLSAQEMRTVYEQFLTTRLANSNIFVDEAVRARKTII